MSNIRFYINAIMNVKNKDFILFSANKDFKETDDNNENFLT